MRVRAVFETASRYLELFPENDQEARLLGAMLPDGSIGQITVSYDGHPSNLKAGKATVQLAPRPEDQLGRT
jgi:hypothetical protein